MEIYYVTVRHDLRSKLLVSFEAKVVAPEIPRKMVCTIILKQSFNNKR